VTGRALKVVSALVGLTLGATSMLVAAELTSDRPRPNAGTSKRLARIGSRPASPSQHPAPARPTTPMRVAADRTVLVVWTPGGVPVRTGQVLQDIPGVVAVTTVEAGLDWITSTRGADEALIDRAPRGMRIPFENAYVDPGKYSEFVPPSERALVRSLSPGQAVLAETSAELRGAGEGLRIMTDGPTLVVKGVIADVSTGGYEAITAGSPPNGWAQTDRFVLVRIRRASATQAVTRSVRGLLEPGTRFRVAARGETPFLRYADAVMPQLLIKRAFGEFAARGLPDGTLVIDPRWRRANIATARVPLLGRVTCHRAIIPQLRNAMTEVRREGLGFTVDANLYGGCYSPRFVNSQPGHRLSHHAWGIAADVNVAENSYGSKPDLDPRLVDIMRRHGFTWGGEWLVPDGMHFEWVRFP
jgi:hypothetical protein